MLARLKTSFARLNTTFQFRLMQNQDVAELLDMEARSNLWPWPESSLRHSMEAGHLCIVCQAGHDSKPVAYAVSSRVLDESSLLNICVSREFQAQGVGRELLLELIRAEAREGARVMYLEVRESNVAAQKLYESLGFICDQVRREYYPAKNGRENARLYSLSLSD